MNKMNFKGADEPPLSSSSSASLRHTAKGMQLLKQSRSQEGALIIPQMRMLIEDDIAKYLMKDNHRVT